jgi:predicted AAA+ superfamily ATPase
MSLFLVRAVVGVGVGDAHLRRKTVNFAGGDAGRNCKVAWQWHQEFYIRFDSRVTASNKVKFHHPLSFWQV